MRIFAYINLSILLLIGIVLSLYFFFVPKREPLVAVREQQSLHLPKNPFAGEIDFDAPAFQLHWVAPQLTLPKLLGEIHFLGKSHRPDIAGGTKFYLSLKNRERVEAFLSKEKCYLKYQNNKYEFSDSPTPLWMEITQVADESAPFDQIEIRLFLQDEGVTITTPPENHLFTLKEEKRGGHPVWEIGGTKVDPSLLLRQGARLIGHDLFLEMHGGEEFQWAACRERLDFLSTTPYSCFIKEGDFLIWNNEAWHTPNEGENTEQYPLLVVKKIDEKVLNFELWDVEGKHKIPLTLARIKAFEPPCDLNAEFKFVGIKTWAECIVECRSKRMVLREGDWVVLEQEGWKKISSETDVDDFVNHKLQGPLFVLEKISKKNGRNVLVGHLFNSLRTQVTQVELTAQDNLLLAELK